MVHENEYPRLRCDTDLSGFQSIGGAELSQAVHQVILFAAFDVLGALLAKEDRTTFDLTKTGARPAVVLRSCCPAMGLVEPLLRSFLAPSILDAARKRSLIEIGGGLSFSAGNKQSCDSSVSMPDNCSSSLIVG